MELRTPYFLSESYLSGKTSTPPVVLGGVLRYIEPNAESYWVAAA